MQNLLILSANNTGTFVIIFLVILYFALIIFSLLDAVRATFNNSATKVIWVLVILFAPFLGSVLYLTIGKSSRM
ncbi:PLDc N-terminal domain-containing protein [Mucilaginibacter phyllosphaerae]|uniref:Cardiolipin synthase N-terminal domain-containing protein n=1 Tax=Mucilaginibacter phyllosphaerae TaxID=1812349 RepID=A0A4Y8A7N7_9SPHI|nr:PLDc N-terminal domain-containing protein [Mucilaginibacter phyllosphaerae]MBB3971014.1 hypothetical protein [Mucilaginibacter phyllosphaerae]TEW63757.1 hypothetical protein E2R65_18480 [Mucilaginibacter phyllosphaerae]